MQSVTLEIDFTGIGHQTQKRIRGQIVSERRFSIGPNYIVFCVQTKKKSLPIQLMRQIRVPYVVDLRYTGERRLGHFVGFVRLLEWHRVTNEFNAKPH